MPTLPVPFPAPLDGGDLPVTDYSQVLKEFSSSHKAPSVAAVRDAFTQSFASGFIQYQESASTAAAQCDPLRATGDYLRSLAAERGVPVSPTDTDDTLRARIFTVPNIVAPAAIVSAVNGLLAPYTSKLCQFYEPEVDGMFVEDGTATWQCFIGSNPHYRDRLYDEDSVENGGTFIAQNKPGGPVPSQGLLRNFVLRIPPLEPQADADFAFAIDAVDEIMPIANGTDASGSESDGTDTTFIYGDSQSSDDLYNAIIGTVESIKGQGMSWSLIVDSTL